MSTIGRRLVLCAGKDSDIGVSWSSAGCPPICRWQRAVDHALLAIVSIRSQLRGWLGQCGPITSGVLPMSADGKTAHDAAKHTVGAGAGVLLVNAHTPDGKRSETPYNGAGDVFVTLVDDRVATWTHAHGASFEQAALVIEAREDEIATLKQQVADLKQQLSLVGSGSSGGDDVAVDAVKALAVALATAGK